jgi:hypothetical protein
MSGKLDVGRVFERIFEIYRGQFALLIGGALALFVPVALIDGLLYEGGGFVLSVIANALALVASYLYQGMVVEAARDILDGRRDQTIGGLFSSAGQVVGPLLVAGILAGIAISIGFVLLIVPGLYLITIWAVIVPVIVIERTGALGSFGRSRQLVKGNGWQVFGVLVVLFVGAFVVQILIAAIIGGVSDSWFGFSLAVLLTSLLLIPLTALAAAVIFFELKALRGEPVVDTGAGGPPAEPTAEEPGATGAASGERPPGEPGTGSGPEAPTPGSQMPPPPPPGSGPAPPPEPGAPPQPAPPPGGSPSPGGDPQPPASGPQAPPSA